MRRRDAAVELDVAAEVEFVGDVVEVLLGLGLKGSDRIFQAQYYKVACNLSFRVKRLAI